MSKSSIAPRRSAASAALSCAVFSLCAQSGAALATDTPDCGGGGGTGTIEGSVAALTDEGRLLCFKRRRASAAREIGFVTGLRSADSRLIGIDYRVQDGMLYGVGKGGGVYRIDTGTAVAEFVNKLSVPLTGKAFGVDFNPAADRLRIVGNDGQNLRHDINVNGTTLVDTSLNYTTGVVATGIAGAAYTNNDLNTTTATGLFDVDMTLDQTALQSPPNAGSLAATGAAGVRRGNRRRLRHLLVHGEWKDEVEPGLRGPVIGRRLAVLQCEPADRQADLHGTIRNQGDRYRGAARAVIGSRNEKARFGGPLLFGWGTRIRT